VILRFYLWLLGDMEVAYFMLAMTMLFCVALGVMFIVRLINNYFKKFPSIDEPYRSEEANSDKNRNGGTILDDRTNDQKHTETEQERRLRVLDGQSAFDCWKMF